MHSNLKILAINITLRSLVIGYVWIDLLNKWENEICDHDDAVESFNENGHIYFQL